MIKYLQLPGGVTKLGTGLAQVDVNNLFEAVSATCARGKVVHDALYERASCYVRISDWDPGGGQRACDAACVDSRLIVAAIRVVELNAAQLL